MAKIGSIFSLNIDFPEPTMTVYVKLDMCVCAHMCTDRLRSAVYINFKQEADKLWSNRLHAACRLVLLTFLLGAVALHT